MNAKLFHLFAETAGVAGLCIGVLLVIFQAILKLNIFPKLNVPDAYKLLRLLIILTFTIGIVGIFAWLANTVIEKPPSQAQGTTHEITGHLSVKDTNNPVEHAQIYVGGMPGGTLSDGHGNFALPVAGSLPSSGANLYASLDGYETARKPVTQEGSIGEIEMMPKVAVAQVEHQQAATPGPTPHRQTQEAGNGAAAAHPAVGGGTPAAGTPPAGQPAVGTGQPPGTVAPTDTMSAQNISLVIDNARLNEWFQTDPNGNAGFWPKSIALVVAGQRLEIASNLTGGNPSIPAFSKTVSVRKGSQHYVFLVELDEKVARRFNAGSTHQSVFHECPGDIQVEHDMKVTPFLTVHGAQITQCKLLADSDPIPDRTQ